MARPHLFEMTPGDLAVHLRSMGVMVRDEETRRVLGHAVSLGRPGFPSARPVPGRVADAIAATTDRHGLDVVARVEDPTDRFVRYVFRSPDGALSEAVRIPLEAPGRFSVCLSSQVGCAMRCAFCATGRIGFSRDLAAWEMVAAFCAVRDEAPGRVSGAVFMGQGEPLSNLDAVLRAARVLCDPCGGRVKAEAVSISTVGIVPAIRRYAAEGHPYRLIVSLTSTVPERRAALLPAASRWSVEEVCDAVRAYAAAARNRVTVAWVVLGGLNTGPEEVEGIRRLLGDLPLRIDLVEVNDPRPGGFRRPSGEELSAFRDALRTLGVPVVRRYSGGVAADAACGMLAARLASGVTASPPGPPPPPGGAGDPPA